MRGSALVRGLRGGYGENILFDGVDLRVGRGERIGNVGNFYQPTVVAGAAVDSRIMNEEPFGPVAIINRFKDLDEVIEEANRLDYSLAAYAFTKSAKLASRIAANVETGMMSINAVGIAFPEIPYGGVKDSGYGREHGGFGMKEFVNAKSLYMG